MPTLGDLLIRVGADLRGFRGAMGDVADEAARGMSKVEREFRSFDKIASNLKSVGVTMTAAITAPLVGIGAIATKEFNAFELAMRQVTSLMGKEGNAAFKGLSEQTLELSKRMGIDAVKASQALYEAISAGVPKENAMTFLEVASKAAIAGVTETKVAVDGLTSIMNAYQLEASQTEEVSDAMFQAVNIGKFTFAELAATMSTAIPLASSLGVGFKEVLGAAASLTTQGFKISEAMTSIQSAMKGIISPNKEMNLLLEKTGFATGQALINAKGFHGALIAIREAAGGSVQKLTDAYGRVEALGAALKLTGDFADKAKGHIAGVVTSTGAMSDAFNQVEQSSSRALERMGARFDVLKIQAGQQLKEAFLGVSRVLESLIDSAIKAVDWFSKLPGPVKSTALAFAAMAAAAGPMMFAVGQSMKIFQDFQKVLMLIDGAALAKLLPSIKGLGSTFADMGRMIAGVDIGAKVSAIQAALMGMSASWLDAAKNIPNATKGVITAIQSFGTQAVAVLATTIANMRASLTALVATIGTGLTAAFAKVGATITAAVATISTAGFAGAFLSLETLAMNSLGILIAAFALAKAAIVSFLSTLASMAAPIALITGAVGVFAALGTAIANNWREIGAVIVAVFADIWSGTKSVFGSIMQAIENTFGPTVANAIRSTWQGVANFFQGIFSFISNIWGNIVKLFTEAIKAIALQALALADYLNMKETQAALALLIDKLEGAKKPITEVAKEAAKIGDAAVPIGKTVTGVAALGDAADTAAKKAKEAAQKIQQAFAELGMKDFAKELKEAEQAYDVLTKAGKLSASQQVAALETIRKKRMELIEALKTPEENTAAFNSNMTALADKALSLSRSFTALYVEGQKIKLATMEYEAFNAALNKVDGSRSFEIFKRLNADMIESSKSAIKLRADLDILGVKRAESIDHILDANKRVQASDEATMRQKLQSELNTLKAIEDNRRLVGQRMSDEERKRMGELDKLLTDQTAKTGEALKRLSSQISTILTDMGKGFADAILHSKNLGEVFTKTAIAIKEAIVRWIIEEGTTKLLKEIKLMDFSFEQLGKNITNLAKDIGNFFKGLTGQAAKASGEIARVGAAAGVDAVGGVAGTAPVGAGAGAGGAAGAGAGAGGALGIANAITGAVSAIASVLQYLQGRRMEQDIGRIEVTTREMQSQLLSIQGDINKYWPMLTELKWLEVIHGAIIQLHDIVSGGFAQLVSNWNKGIVDEAGTAAGMTEQVVEAIAESAETISQAVVEHVGIPISELASSVRPPREGSPGERRIVDALNNGLKPIQNQLEFLAVTTDANGKVIFNVLRDVVTGEIIKLKMVATDIVSAVESAADQISEAVDSGSGSGYGLGGNDVLFTMMGQVVSHMSREEIDRIKASIKKVFPNKIVSDLDALYGDYSSWVNLEPGPRVIHDWTELEPWQIPANLGGTWQFPELSMGEQVVPTMEELWARYFGVPGAGSVPDQMLQTLMQMETEWNQFVSDVAAGLRDPVTGQFFGNIPGVGPSPHGSGSLLFGPTQPQLPLGPSNFTGPAMHMTPVLPYWMTSQPQPGTVVGSIPPMRDYGQVAVQQGANNLMAGTLASQRPIEITINVQTADERVVAQRLVRELSNVGIRVN
jgi:TP901 family phage tail tape measure protein